MSKTPINGSPALPNSGMRLAMLLQAIDACDRGFAQERDDYKARRKVLENQLHSLKLDIITGQKSLLDVLEPLDGMVIEGPNGVTGTVHLKKGEAQ